MHGSTPLSSIDAAAVSLYRNAATQVSNDDATNVAAEKVESMFASMLIKTLRQTSGEDGMFPGDKSDALGSIFDQYLGDEIARSGGLGLAKSLAHQIGTAEKGAAP